MTENTNDSPIVRLARLTEAEHKDADNLAEALLDLLSACDAVNLERVVVDPHSMAAARAALKRHRGD